MSKYNGLTADKLSRKRKIVEIIAVTGLILIAIGLVVPFGSIENTGLAFAMRIIYAIGALMYTGARMVNVNSKDDSMRLRKLRRMEMWAGFCFIAGGVMWFYNAHRLSFVPFSLPVMRDTVAFSMAGAVIQVVASWMIASRMKKEAGSK